MDVTRGSHGSKRRRTTAVVLFSAVGLSAAWVQEPLTASAQTRSIESNPASAVVVASRVDAKPSLPKRGRPEAPLSSTVQVVGNGAAARAGNIV